MMAVAASAMARAFRSGESDRTRDSGPGYKSGQNFVELLGGFPAKRPLEVHATGQDQEDGYVRRRIFTLLSPALTFPHFC